MNNEDFVSYEIAVKLKELGFNWNCHAFYWTDDGTFKETTYDVFNNPYSNCITMVAAPNLAHAQKWLRKRGLCVSVYPSPFSEDINGEYVYKVYQFMDYEEWNDLYTEYSEDYESALSAGIEVALKLIEEGEK